MIRHQILPAVSDYADQLCQRAYHKDAMGVPHQYETSTAMQIGTLTDALQADCAKLEADLAAIPVGSIKAMNYCHEVLIPDMAEAREGRRPAGDADCLQVLAFPGIQRPAVLRIKCARGPRPSAGALLDSFVTPARRRTAPK